MPTFDDLDRDIVAERMAGMDEHAGPRVGDYVDFGDGVTRRISYVWPGEPEQVQTSNDGRFHLGDSGVGFSGSLFLPVPADTLSPTDEVRNGEIWIFHHDHHSAHNGVETSIPFRVYRCSLPAPAC